MTKDEASRGLQASHQEFMNRLEAFSPTDAEWTTPLPSGTWRLRDVAAHITAWDRVLAADMRLLPEGHVPGWLSWDDATTDEVNARQVRERAGWSIERLRSELRAGRAELLDAVAVIDEDRFGQTYSTGDAETSPAGLCAYWIRHDQAHTADLAAAAEATRPA